MPAPSLPAPRFHALARLFFCALGVAVASLVVGVSVGLAVISFLLFSGNSPREPLDQLLPRYALPITLLTYPVSLLWMAFCRVRFDKRSFVSLGFRERRAFSDAARGALSGALSIGLLWSILWISGAISVHGIAPEALEMGLLRSVGALLAYAAVFVSVGFFEEALFRGYALHNLHAWLGWKGAVAVQAIVFALVHLNNVASAPSEARLAALGALPSIALIAVFFALCYRKTGSLWFPIGFHFAWNYCLGCVFSLPVSGLQTFHLLDVQSQSSSWLSGGSFGAEGSFLLIPIIGALIFFIAGQKDHPQALLDLELMRSRVEIPVLNTPETDEEEEEEERDNRFRTKFGSSQGFSADTLQELRELQEAREKQAREAAEAARRNDLAVSVFAPPPLISPEILTSEVPTETAPAVELAPFEATEIPLPKVETPKVEVPVPKTTELEPENALVKKKSTPRW